MISSYECERKYQDSAAVRRVENEPVLGEYFAGVPARVFSSHFGTAYYIPNTGPVTTQAHNCQLKQSVTGFLLIAHRSNNSQGRQQLNQTQFNWEQKTLDSGTQPKLKTLNQSS